MWKSSMRGEERIGKAAEMTCGYDLNIFQKTNGEVLNVNTYIKRPSDLLLASWFKGKCLQQASWCQ